MDIIKKKLHRIDLNQGPSSHEEIDLGIAVGTTADIAGDDDHFAFGGKYGFGKMNKRTGEYQMIKKYWAGEVDEEEKEKKYRGNDGAVDAKGRYFVGTMRDPLVNNITDDGK